MKLCVKCHKNKVITDFYKHKGMSDGHLNKCKECTKKESKNRLIILKNDPIWVEKEKKRTRERNIRLNYKDKYKGDPKKKLYNLNHKLKFPEKFKARTATNNLNRKSGYELHHWSYNEEHFKDVIELTVQDHNLLHINLIYDKIYLMYRDKSGILLNTKESHIKYLKKLKDC